jgi:hypothetical protein
LLVRWAYSFVVILVIAALFSTPLILGSIKNRVYMAVKEQVEKENNAREITIQQAENVPLDRQLLKSLSSTYTNKTVGNLKSVVMVDGPAGAQIQTLQTLVYNDPRTEALQITPKIPANFGLFYLVVSDQLGESLYGQKWHELWSKDGSKFMGKPLRLSINDIPLEGEFNIVARQTTLGRKIYASEQLGECLKKYSIGFGCEEVGLPLVPEQVQYGLPRFETMHCLLDFPLELCDSYQQTKIRKRLEAENFQVEETPSMAADMNRFQVTLTKFNESKGIFEPTKGDCEQRLYHHLEACPSSVVTPKISVKVQLNKSDSLKTIQLAGISPDAYEFLPGIEEMTNKWGGRKLDFWTEGIPEDGIEMVAPYDINIPLGTVELRVTKAELRVTKASSDTSTLPAFTKASSDTSTLPAFITAYYQCPEGMDCPFYTRSDLAFRLQNLINGTAIFKFDENVPPRFYPSKQQQRIDYDEILFYANHVEEVENLDRELEKTLPGYNVQYNIYAIDKLKRQDQRLSTLFQLTLWVSVVFILLAVSALAKINIDRRRRQMAQLFILGHSKFYVGLLLVFEYVLLTVLGSLLAIGVGWVIFTAAGYYLQSGLAQQTEFTTIVNAMSLDIGAFSVVFLLVVSVTTVVASIAAFFTSRIDPVELLD